MHLPNYKFGGIVNLMSSIGAAFGVERPYTPKMDPARFSRKNVVLMVLDALGYNFLFREGKGSVIHSNLEICMDSVFPTTTATAITSFTTGHTPEKHGISGWAIYLEGADIVANVIPYHTWEHQTPLSEIGIQIEDVILTPPMASELEGTPFCIINQQYWDSEYNIFLAGNAERVAYGSLEEYFAQIQAVVARDADRKFVFAYWPLFDKLIHMHGPSSEEVKAHFWEIDAGLQALVKGLKGTDTTLVITSDHGAIDTPPSQCILLNEHELLLETLRAPPSGDARVRYCHVEPGREVEFEAYVEGKLRHACSLNRSADLIRMGAFGLNQPDPRFEARVGDYTLLANPGYSLVLLPPGVDDNILRGNHGGTTPDELLVPLTIIDC